MICENICLCSKVCKYNDGHNEWCKHPEKCPNLNDKSQFIELPCDVGTELFLSDYPMHHHRLKEYEFIGNRVVMVIECFEYQRTCKRFVDEHFGKTVFLTKEEADNARESERK